MAMDLHTVEAQLQEIVAEFEMTATAARRMRRLAADEPAHFCTASIPYLRSDDESNAHRLMAILVLRHESVLESLVSPLRNTRGTALKRLTAPARAFAVLVFSALAALRILFRPARSLWVEARPVSGGGAASGQTAA